MFKNRVPSSFVLSCFEYLSHTGSTQSNFVQFDFFQSQQKLKKEIRRSMHAPLDAPLGAPLDAPLDAL